MTKILMTLTLLLPLGALGAEGETAAPVSPAAQVESVATTPAAKAQTAPATGAKARTQQSIEAFLKVKTAPEGKALDEAAKKANAEAFKELDGFLGWDDMTSSILKPHLGKLTKKQAQTIRAVFSEAVRLVAYPASGDFFREAEWKYQRVEGNDVTIYAFFPEEDLEMESTFHWKDSGQGLKIVDLSIDGDSLAQDYRNQFGRIISKHGGKGLVERLEKARDKELEAVKGILP